jgi:hypothetical protein
MAEIFSPSLVYDRAEGTDDDHTQRDNDKDRDDRSLTGVTCHLLSFSAVCTKYNHETFAA